MFQPNAQHLCAVGAAAETANCPNEHMLPTTCVCSMCVPLCVCVPCLAAIAAGFHYASRQFQAAHLDYAHLSRVLCAAFAIFMCAHVCVCVGVVWHDFWFLFADSPSDPAQRSRFVKF